MPLSPSAQGSCATSHQPATAGWWGFRGTTRGSPHTQISPVPDYMGPSGIGDGHSKRQKEGSAEFNIFPRSSQYLLTGLVGGGHAVSSTLVRAAAGVVGGALEVELAGHATLLALTERRRRTAARGCQRLLHGRAAHAVLSACRHRRNTRTQGELGL